MSEEEIEIKGKGAIVGLVTSVLFMIFMWPLGWYGLLIHGVAGALIGLIIGNIREFKYPEATLTGFLIGSLWQFRIAIVRAMAGLGQFPFHYLIIFGLTGALLALLSLFLVDKKRTAAGLMALSVFVMCFVRWITGPWTISTVPFYELLFETIIESIVPVIVIAYVLANPARMERLSFKMRLWG